MRDVSGIIAWLSLGCPTQPGYYGHNGRLIRITQKNIEAAAGEPHATFRLIYGKVIDDGSHRYMLGSRVN